MSIIKITHHDENIYNIKQKGAIFQESSPRHVSRYQTLVSRDYQKSRCKPHALMGLSHYPPPDPKNYLKKKAPKPQKLKCPKKLGTMVETPPPLPSSTPTCVPTLKECKENEKRRSEKIATPKDFVRENIKKISCSKSKDLPHVVIDTRTGHRQNLEGGLEPKFIFSKKFGKKPGYLRHFIEERQQLHMTKKEVFGTEQPKCRYITREEREDLLAGLKQNWAELQKQYQGLPILTDTIPKINRKSKMEADLKQLEKDIVMIERHPYIYVYNDINEEPN